jgi:N-acetylglutamate synthase-like GNAT family acetyltransferase
VIPVKLRKAVLPHDAESIRSLLKYIDLSIYPECGDIENPDDQWFVCEEKSGIIGCVASRKTTGEVRHIVVLPAYRRKGIGRQLANSAIECLRKIGCSKIWGQIRVNNENSQRLFESLGFKRVPKPITSRKNHEVKLYKYILEF